MAVGCADAGSELLGGAVRIHDNAGTGFGCAAPIHRLRPRVQVQCAQCAQCMAWAAVAWVVGNDDRHCCTNHQAGAVSLEDMDMSNDEQPVAVEVVVASKAHPNPITRLRELLSVPERVRTDAQWDEIIEIEIAMGPRKPLPASGKGQHPQFRQNDQREARGERPNKRAGGGGGGGGGGNKPQHPHKRSKGGNRPSQGGQPGNNPQNPQNAATSSAGQPNQAGNTAPAAAAGGAA